jgi:aspartyl protease family protein
MQYWNGPTEMQGIKRVVRVLIELVLAAVVYSLPAWADAIKQIELFALFEGKAIVKIDGARHVLSTGERSPEGVMLVATDTRQETAQIEVNGHRETLTLGMVTSGGLKPAPGENRVTLWADTGGFFYTDGSINGVPVKFLVDTGANTIALSSAMADRIGLDYKREGRPSIASTASGLVRMYSVSLQSVAIGGITLYNIDAGVIEGEHPQDVLLGMSFLGQLDMTRDGDRMELRKR